MVEDLPEPARRWLRHAIAPGTPLAAATELTMHGTIRLGTWRRFTATQVLAPPDGYIWAATARFLGLPVVGYDRMSSGTATMRWRLLDMIPVMNAEGPEIARSAAGRLAAEVVLAPTAFRGATWTAGGLPDTAVGLWHIGGDEQRVEVRVGLDGTVRGVLIERWGRPPGAPYGQYPFGSPSTPSEPSAASPSPRRCGQAGGGAPTGRTRASSSAPRSPPPSIIDVRLPGDPGNRTSRIGQEEKAPTPVMSRPTISVWMCSVPS